MPTGSIKFFDDKKGFGFIKPDDAGADAYISWYEMETDKIQGPKALHARQLRAGISSTRAAWSPRKSG